jgi:hypothetical protein
VSLLFSRPPTFTFDRKPSCFEEAMEIVLAKLLVVFWRVLSRVLTLLQRMHTEARDRDL